MRTGFSHVTTRLSCGELFLGCDWPFMSRDKERVLNYFCVYFNTMLTMNASIYSTLIYVVFK